MLVGEAGGCRVPGVGGTAWRRRPFSRIVKGTFRPADRPDREIRFRTNLHGINRLTAAETLSEAMAIVHGMQLGGQGQPLSG